jgi:hypothetical protein
MKGIRQMLIGMWINREKKFQAVFLSILCAIADGMNSNHIGQTAGESHNEMTTRWEKTILKMAPPGRLHRQGRLKCVSYFENCFGSGATLRDFCNLRAVG